MERRWDKGELEILEENWMLLIIILTLKVYGRELLVCVLVFILKNEA